MSEKSEFKGFVTGVVLTIAYLFMGATSAHARTSDDYDVMTWKTLKTVSFLHPQQVEINARDIEGQFVRVKAPASCGYLALAISAEGNPVTPRMIYDEDAKVVTPEMRRLHWFVGQERIINFSKIWLTVSEIEYGRCTITVETSEG